MNDFSFSTCMRKLGRFGGGVGRECTRQIRAQSASDPSRPLHCPQATPANVGSAMLRIRLGASKPLGAERTCSLQMRFIAISLRSLAFQFIVAS